MSSDRSMGIVKLETFMTDTDQTDRPTDQPTNPPNDGRTDRVIGKHY